MTPKPAGRPEPISPPEETRWTGDRVIREVKKLINQYWPYGGVPCDELVAMIERLEEDL